MTPNQLIDGRDGGETGAATVHIVRISAAVIQRRAPQTGLGYTMFLMSRCYGTRPHDKWHSPYQLLKNMPYFQIKTDGWYYRAPRRSPQASSLPGDRSVFSFLIVSIAVCFPRRRQHLRDFFLPGKQLPGPCWDTDRLIVQQSS